MGEAVVVQRLGKCFPRYRADRPRTWKAGLAGGVFKRRAVEMLWALRDVSVRIPHGQAMGIVGANGSGKTTLLRLISKVLRPDEGTLEVNGQVQSLLELGVGFHPDLTGRQNAVLAGVIDGSTRREIARRLESIAAFAELSAFMDSPLRTYSAGMQLRLAFAVAAQSSPDILLIDEALAVGDLSFQEKCLRRLRELREQGCTVLLVSHDTRLVKELCDEVLWLHEGRLFGRGDPEDLITQYAETMRAETTKRTSRPVAGRGAEDGDELRLHETRFGSLEAEITSVRLLDEDGLDLSELNSGGALQVEVEFQAPGRIEGPIFGVSISRPDGLVCVDTSTAASGAYVSTIDGRGRIALHIERLDLAAGAYYVDVGIYERSWRYAYDYHWHVYPLTIVSAARSRALVHPPHHWELEQHPFPRPLRSIR